MEPAFPNNQRQFVRALADVGATVIGVGERPADWLDDELKSWMTHYHQIPNVTDVRALGSRPFTDVFVADVGVRVGDDRKVYLGFYESGADALQTELPDEVLKAVGRPVPP